MIPEGASAILTKIADVDRNSTPSPNEPYRKNVDCICSLTFHIPEEDVPTEL